MLEIKRRPWFGENFKCHKPRRCATSPTMVWKFFPSAVRLVPLSVPKHETMPVTCMKAMPQAGWGAYAIASMPGYADACKASVSKPLEQQGICLNRSSLSRRCLANKHVATALV